MYRDMRRQDRVLTKKEAMELLESGKYGVLALNGKDGYPYGVPMHYAVMNGKIYMHSTREESLKAECIAANPKVSFTVIHPVEGMKSKSVIVFGTCAVVPELRGEVLEAMIEKFIPEIVWPQVKAGVPFAKENITAFEITIDHISGKVVDKPEK